MATSTEKRASPSSLGRSNIGHQETPVQPGKCISEPPACYKLLPFVVSAYSGT